MSQCETCNNIISTGSGGSIVVGLTSSRSQWLPGSHVMQVMHLATPAALFVTKRQRSRNRHRTFCIASKQKWCFFSSLNLVKSLAADHTNMMESRRAHWKRLRKSADGVRHNTQTHIQLKWIWISHQYSSYCINDLEQNDSQHNTKYIPQSCDELHS